jgi:DNA modification methylase
MAQEATTTKAEEMGSVVVEWLDPKAIKVGWRARKDDGDISELAESIQRIGQLHDITVRRDKDGAPVIIAGLRRLRACRKLGIKVRALVIKPEDELAVLTIQLEENIKRKNFDRLEVGEGLKRYKSLYEKKLGLEKGWNLKSAMRAEGKAASADSPGNNFVAQTARSLGVSKATIWDLLGIGDLPDEDKKEIAKAKTTRERNVAASKALSKVRKGRKLKKLEVEAGQKEKARAKASKDSGKKDDQRIFVVEGDYRVELKAKTPGMPLKGTVDLICTDPMYDLERNPILHTDRTNINEASLSKWDRLDISWVLDVAPLLSPTGTLIAFTPLELVGLYKVACLRAKLTYRGCIVWHKCVSENTLVPVVTEDGLHRLRPIEIQPGDRIISVGDDGGAVLAKVVSTERMGHRESLVQITLADGNTVAITSDHRIPIRGGKLVEAGKLAVGDMVQVATMFPVEEPGSEYKEAREMGRVAGVWLGDGGASSSRASRVDFYLSRAKAETVAFLEAALPRFFDAKVNKFIDGEEGIRLYTNSDQLRSFLGGVFEGRTSKTKRIRPQAFFQGREFLQGLSDGFCETDGGWDDQNQRWRFNQGNGELMRDYSILLKVLGVPAKLRQPRIADDGTGAAHVCWPMEFRPQPSEHHNATFKSDGAGVAGVKVVKVEEVQGAVVWDLAVDSASHLFAVDHGMLVHNSNPPPAHRSVYAPSCEAIIWATRGDKYTFKPWSNAGTGEAHNHIDHPICGGNERLAHPFQKPLALVQRLVDRHTDKASIVFDPFMGTGTTIVAAAKLNLRGSGVEKEAKFCRMAVARLAST